MVNTININGYDYPLTLSVKDVQGLLGIGEKNARTVIKELNAELTKAGKKVIKGRIFTQYLMKRYCMI